MPFLELANVFSLLKAATFKGFPILSISGVDDSMKILYDRAYLSVSLNATKALVEIAFS